MNNQKLYLKISAKHVFEKLHFIQLPAYDLS